MEAVLTELDEVVVTPYNLTGDITRDLKRISTAPVVTASTLGLPNAHVRKMDQNERLINQATSGGHRSLEPDIEWDFRASQNVEGPRGKGQALCPYTTGEELLSGFPV